MPTTDRASVAASATMNTRPSGMMKPLTSPRRSPAFMAALVSRWYLSKTSFGASSMVSMTMIAGAFFHHFVIDLTMDSTVGTGKPRPVFVTSGGSGSCGLCSALAGASLPSLSRIPAIISSSAARAAASAFSPSPRLRNARSSTAARSCVLSASPAFFRHPVRLMGQESSRSVAQMN